MKNHPLSVCLAVSLAFPVLTLAQNTFPFPANGSVGIGTTQPGKLLDVNGDARVNGWLWIDAPEATAPRLQASRQLFLQTAGNQPLFLNAFSGGGDVFVGGAQGAAPNLLVRGNLGVGIDAPQTKLHVVGNATIDGEFVMPGTLESGSRFISNQRLHIQTLNGQPIFLNPFADGGDVSVGKNLVVNGKVTARTLELTSDRNQKQNLQPVAINDILAKVVGLPISTWAYTNAPGVPHLGPMAQDFKAAFGLGEDDKHIGAGDGIGVALAAIQGLHAMVQDKNSEIASLKSRLAAMEKNLAAREGDFADRLAAVEKALAKNVQQAGVKTSEPEPARASAVSFDR